MPKHSEYAITVEGISKRYRIGKRERAETLSGQVKNAFLYPIRNLKEITRLGRFKEAEDDDTVFWALRDLNFEVKKGEVLGVIGPNGAGKSTLLKIISRITEPTTGEINIQGRVSSLLEVGTGFHQELTGRDNVYMNGTILGMTKREVDRKFDEIVSFSGVEKHLDTPVKFYSSGMKVRLAFAVAAHLDPEVLIIDEVLAVGDLSFQRKCLGKMDDVSKSGRTIVFVSHDMGAVEGLCDRVMVLNNGTKAYEGNSLNAIINYRNTTLESIDTEHLSTRTDRTGAGNLRFTKVRFNQQESVVTGGRLQIELFYEAKHAIQNLQLTFKICRTYREILMAIDSKLQGQNIHVTAGNGCLKIDVPNLYLMPGTYIIDLWASANGLLEDKIFNAAKLMVEESDVYGTGNAPDIKKHGLVVAPKCQWRF